MRKQITLLLLILVMVITGFIYRAALNGPFIYDDGINIVNNQALRLTDITYEDLTQAAYSVSSGPLSRPLSMLSFAANFYIDRDKVQPFLSAYPFKLTNLFIHLVNGLLVYFFVLQLLWSRGSEKYVMANASWVALAISAIWLLHPLNLTSVLYVVQRMTSLATLFTLTGLNVYLVGRRMLNHGTKHAFTLLVLSVVVFTPLAALSKENGILLPAYLLAIEYFIFNFKCPDEINQRWLRRLIYGLLIAPIALALIYGLCHADVYLAGYAKRSFTLSERLMTESRVLWFYLRQIVLPSNALLAFHHDDFLISKSLASPLSTLPSIFGLLILMVTSWIFRKKQALLAFGIMFFLLGHTLESTVIPLELIHEHRNYLPMLGILIAILAPLLGSGQSPDTFRIRYALVTLVALLFAFCTAQRTEDWSSEYALWSSEARHHPESVRAQGELAAYYSNALTSSLEQKEGLNALAEEQYKNMLSLERYNTVALFGLIGLYEDNPNKFDKKWVDNLKLGLRQEALSSNVNDQLIKLSSCLLEKSCQLTAVDIDQLMAAALENPRVTGRERALVYNAITFYKFKVLHELDSALVASKQAVALDTDMEHRIWLIEILIAMGNKNEANSEITTIRELDIHQLKREDIARLERLLTESP